MNKPIRRSDNIPENAKIRFIDKRTTIMEEIDGSVTYYDLEHSLLCEGYISQNVRGYLEKHDNVKPPYYTFTFHYSDTKHYRNFYVARP